MAVEWLPSIGFTLTLPNPTTLTRFGDRTAGAFAQDPPDNCESIVVVNLSTTDRVLIKFAQEGTVSAASMTLANSTVIPVSSSMTFGIGVIGPRPALITGGVAEGFLKPETGQSVPVNVSYIQGPARRTNL